MKIELHEIESIVRAVDAINRIMADARSTLRKKGYKVGVLSGGAYIGWAGEVFTMAVEYDGLRISVNSADKVPREVLRQFVDAVNNVAPLRKVFADTIGINEDGSFKHGES